MFSMLLMFLLMCLATMVGAQEIVANAGTIISTIPDQPTLSNIFDAIVELVVNWKVLGSFGIASAILSILIMCLKADFTDFLFKWSTKGHYVKILIIVILGQGAGIIAAISTGMKWQTAVFSGLITSGGAMVIYNAAKPLFKAIEIETNSAAKPL